MARVKQGTRVLDLACGKGEMLCRWAQDFGSRGVGVDISEGFVTAARSRAEKLGVADRVVIQHGDAQTFEPEPEAFDIASCVGATWIGNGVAGTIDLLGRAITSDGLLLIGEPYWREPPSSEAERALGEDVLRSMPNSATCLAFSTGSTLPGPTSSSLSWPTSTAGIATLPHSGGPCGCGLTLTPVTR